MERSLGSRPQEIRRSLVPDFASFYGESILPPSVEGRGLTQEQFRENFPVRYSIWHQVNDALRDTDLASPLGSSEESDRLRTRLHLLNRFDRYAIIHNREPGHRILRPRQVGVFTSIHNALEKGEDEATIQAPTGLGKTVIFGQVVAAADVPSLIVVPTQLLVEQTYESFKRFAPHVDVGRVYEEEKEVGRKVIITTYSTLVLDKDSKLLNPEGTKLIILDEAHEGMSDKRIEKIETVEGFRGAVILSFSATPVRIDDPKLNEKRVVKASRNLIHEISEREAIEEGYLAPFTGVRVEVDVDLSEVPRNQNGEYEETGLDKKLNTQVQNEAALQFFQEIRERDRAQSIQNGRPVRPLTTSAYASSISHAQQLAKLFSEAGISAAAVWGDQTAEEIEEWGDKDENLKKWAAGEIEVIFSKDLLVRGLDLPRIRFVMNIAPTASPIVEKQRCGRGLRLDPDNPDKHTIIADFVYNNTRSVITQVTYPELLDSAQIVRRVESEDGSLEIPHGGGGFGNLEDIEIEGLKVITRPEDIMTIQNRIRQEIDDNVPPPGWKVMGQRGLAGTLAESIGRKPDIIAAGISQILSEMEAQANEKGEPFFPLSFVKSFKNKSGRPSLFYSPELETILIDRLKPLEKAPEGWLLLGERRVKGSLSDLLRKEPSWVLNRIPGVTEEIKQEYLEAGVPVEEQPSLIKQYQSRRGPATFYSPVIIERLQSIVNSEVPPPEGWVRTGEGEAGTLTGILGKSWGWIFPRLSAISREIEAEMDEKGIPLEEHPLLQGLFTSHGRTGTYFSPLAVERLQQIVEQLKPVPEGWVGTGQGAEDKSGISGLVSRTSDWVRLRVPGVIDTIHKRWTDEGIPEELWPSLAGEFDSTTGVATFYSPEIIPELQILANKEQDPPDGWKVLGDRTDKSSLAGILDRDRDWAARRIPIVLEQIQREMEEQGMPLLERPTFTGEYLTERRTLRPFFSPEVLERLRVIQENEPPPPPGWLPVSDKRALGSISGLLELGRERIMGMIPRVLAQLQDDYERRGVPVSERPQLSGEFYSATGKGTYYSPEVVEGLLKLKEYGVI